MVTLPVWVFEADVFGQTADAVRNEVRRQGMGLLVTRQDLLARGLGDCLNAQRLAPRDCAMAFGCFPFVQHVLSQQGWIPGGWVNADRLACSSYYPPFSRWLLNQHHRILLAWKAAETAGELFAEFGRDGQVFLRPDGCEKLFTGQLVDEGTFPLVLGPARYSPDTLVVVAQPRRISQEWRLIVSGDEVIASSQYFAESKVDVLPGCPAEVRHFAVRLLADVSWRPDEIFMLDVCKSQGELALLEINSFSCSAFYACDPAAIVRTATGLARLATSSPG